MPKFATIGSSDCLGGTQFGEFENVGQVVNPPTAVGTYRTQYGFGQRSARGWTRPESYSLPAVAASGSESITVTVSSVSGAVLGRLRTDIEKPVLHSIEFTLDENGCADFTLRLNRLPTFEILPFSIIDVTIANTSFQWFSGVITTVDEAGTRGGAFANPDKNRPFEYRGFGLRRYIDDLRADVDFAALRDVGDVARELFRDYVVGVDEAAPFSPVRYNASKIDATTGVVLANAIELGKFSLRQVFDTLAQMASARWGVDGDGETYFEMDSGAIVRTFAIGYRVNEFEPKYNYDEIKNAIIVQRQEGRGSGGAGWSVAGIYNDAASVKTYGRRELIYQIPGFFSDADADIIGESLRDSLSQPQLSAEIDGLVIESGADYFERGTYRFIMPLAIYRETIDDLNDASAAGIAGSGDLAIATDATFGDFMYSTGSVRLDFQNAANQRVEWNVTAEGIIKEIRFYIKSSATGGFLTVGVGENQWNENTATIDLIEVNEFRPFIWDVSELNLRRIGKFAIKVNANQSSAVQVWVNKLDVIFRGHKSYNMRLKRVTYSFSPRGAIARAEFGKLPKRISDYVSGLLATAQELKFTGEVR
jgi:hypothetical protein